MYHYLGSFKLYETSKYSRFSGYRCLCRIENAYFSSLLDFIDREEIAPGEYVNIQASFLYIDLVAPKIQIDSVYQICDGSQPIGEILIKSMIHQLCDRDNLG